jgi:hypothetical protein
MLSELDDALLEAGASEEQARTAAVGRMACGYPAPVLVDLVCKGDG